VLGVQSADAYPPRLMLIDEHEIRVCAHSEVSLPVVDAPPAGGVVAAQADDVGHRELALARVGEQQRQHRLDSDPAAVGPPHVGLSLLLGGMRRVVGCDGVDVAAPDALPERVDVGLRADRRVQLDQVPVLVVCVVVQRQVPDEKPPPETW